MVPITRKVVCEQTRVLEVGAEDVGEEEDRFVLGVLARWERDVGLDSAYCFEFAYWKS